MRNPTKTRWQIAWYEDGEGYCTATSLGTFATEADADAAAREAFDSMPDSILSWIVEPVDQYA